LEEFTTDTFFSEYFEQLSTYSTQYKEDIRSNTLMLTLKPKHSNLAREWNWAKSRCSFYVYFRTCRTDQLDPSRSAVISYLAGHLNQSTNVGRSKPLPLLEPSNISVRSNSTDQKKDQTMAVVKKKLRKNKKELKETTSFQTNITRYKQKKKGHFVETDYTIPCNCPFT
jgi:hypothetical protein